MPGKENEIKTRLTLDGEKEFKRGINSINQEMRLSNAQLKEVAATYDLNGNAQDRLTAKSRILREQVAAQNRIVQQYEERMRQAEQATDLSAEGLRGYSIQLTNARTKAKQLEKELADTDRELEELGRDSRRAGDQLENSLGEAAGETESKLQKLARSVNDTLGGMKKLQRVSVAVDIVRGAWDLGESLANYVQSATEDGMRRAMVQYNIGATGGNVGQSMTLANQYAAIFGDKDSSYEAIANLAAAGYKDESLLQMSRYIGGAAIRFQDTLKIESLADSLQETLSEGVLTGQISELVNRMAGETGISVEQVNKQLAEAKKKGNEQVALEAYLSNAGLDTYYDNFIKQNEGLVESATALQEFNTALNDLAVTTLPLLTPAIKGMTEMIEGVSGKMPQITSAIDSVIEWVEKKFGIEVLTPTEIKENETFEGFVANDENAARERGKRKAREVILGTNNNAWATTGSQSEQKMIADLLAEYAAGDAFVGPKMDNAFAEGFREIYSTGWNNRGEVLRGIAAEQNTVIRGRLQSKGIVPSTQEIENIGLLEAVKNELTQAGEEATAGGKTIGSNLTTGLQSQSLRLLAAAAQQRALLERVWKDPIKPTVVVGYQMAGPVNTSTPKVNVTVTPAPVVMNGRTLTQVIFDKINTQLGIGAD